MPEGKNEVAVHIVELIMAQHWDMAACQCWICKRARAADMHPWEHNLEESSRLGHVKIGDPWKKLEDKTDYVEQMFEKRKGHE